MMIKFFVSVFMNILWLHTKHISDTFVFLDCFPFKTLADRVRYEPTQADVVVYKSLPNAPDKATHPHAARWYTHITSWTAEHASLPGDSKKTPADYVPTLKAAAATTKKAAPAAAAEEDDDEVDLFGSDDEDDAEAERVKQERLEAYAEKKATKPKTIAKSIVTLDVLFILKACG